MNKELWRRMDRPGCLAADGEGQDTEGKRNHGWPVENKDTIDGNKAVTRRSLMMDTSLKGRKHLQSNYHPTDIWPEEL